MGTKSTGDRWTKRLWFVREREATAAISLSDTLNEWEEKETMETGMKTNIAIEMKEVALEWPETVASGKGKRSDSR